MKQVSLSAHLFLFVACLNTSVFPRGVDAWPPEISKAYSLVRQFRMGEAEEVLRLLDPSPEKAYVADLREFMLLMYHQISYEQYLKNSAERETWVQPLPDISNWKAFYLSELRLHRALAKINNEDYVSGLYDLWQARRLLESIEDLHHFTPLLKPAGTINLITGLAPGGYRWLFDLLGFEGSVETGLLQLNSLATTETAIGGEARMILGFFYLYPLGNAAQAGDYFRKELEGNPENNFARLMLATALSKSYLGTEALELLLNSAPQAGDLPFHHYLLGDLYLQKGDYINCRLHYEKFLAAYSGPDYRKDVYSKIAISHQLQGGAALAGHWGKLALREPGNKTEPDRNAAAILNELSSYPRSLLAARFACDGGYWGQAEAALKEFPPPADKRWAAEYHYRTARLLHLTGKPAAALEHYATATEMSQGQNWYIGPSAAMQAGDILVSERKFQEARAFYKQALSFEDHPYKKSIDQKAKHQLSLLAGK